MKKEKKKHVIFDLDWTIFNTAFIYNKLGINFFQKKIVFNMEIAKKINWENIKPGDLLFPGVKKLLQKLKKKNYLIYLFSEGEIQAQKFKLKIANLKEFFANENIIICQDKKSAIPNFFKKITSFKEIWYLDDIPNNLLFAKTLKPELKTVLICQNPRFNYDIREKTFPFEIDYTLKKIGSFINLIK